MFVSLLNWYSDTALVFAKLLDSLAVNDQCI